MLIRLAAASSDASESGADIGPQPASKGHHPKRCSRRGSTGARPALHVETLIGRVIRAMLKQVIGQRHAARRIPECDISIGTDSNRALAG